jgi:type IV secretion system protein VirD4
MLQSWDSKWRYPLALFVGLSAGTYIGAMIATIYVMFVFGDNLNSIDFLNPWFLRYSYDRIALNSAIEQTTWLITSVPAFLLAIVGLTSVHRGSLTDYDDAHFQTRAELRRNKMVVPLNQNGFIFGKLTKPKKKGRFISAMPDRFPHALMIAPTGRGKGIGFVLPNLLHFNGSAVILDVKGENFEKTSVHRQKALNNDVWYFSPYDYVMPEDAARAGSKPFTRTHRFNPLARVAALPSQEQQYTAINTMADLFLIVESINAQSFFQAGRSLFVASCLYAIEKGNPTIGEALRIMSGGGSKKTSYLEAATQTSNPTVAEIFLAMADETDKILDSYVSVIRGAGLELWLDPAVDRATSASDFDFSTFRSQPQSLYIVVQPEHLKTLAPLIRLLFADAIASLQRAAPRDDEPHKVMFLMDEFDQLGKQPLVLNSIKTIRSYGGRFFIISQSVPGLDGIYGETDRRSLQGGAGVQIYMTPQDDRTAETLSGVLGKRTVVSKTRSHSAVRSINDSSNISRRAEERPLISSSEILRFPLDKVLVLAEGQYPILAHHIRYYEDHHFRAIDEARQGFALPYPPLVQPTASSPPKMPKHVADVQTTEKPKTESDILGALAAGQTVFRNIENLAINKKRPTRSGSGKKSPPKRRS